MEKIQIYIVKRLNEYRWRFAATIFVATSPPKEERDEDFTCSLEFKERFVIPELP